MAIAAGTSLWGAPEAAAFQTPAPVLDAAPELVAQPIPTTAPLTAVPGQHSPAAGAPLAAAPAVDLYYQARSNAPLWFRDAAARDAARLLPASARRGCAALARWLLGKEPAVSSEAPEQHVRIGSPVPIFLMHLALPDEAPADGAQLASVAAGDPLAGAAAASRESSANR